MNPSTPRILLGAAWLCAFTAGLGAGTWAYREAREERLHALEVDARRCALALDPERVAALQGDKDDLASPAYRAIKDRLVQLRTVHPDVHFVSLFRWTSRDGQVAYLADSEPDGSADLSLPGDPFPEAPAMPGLQSILRDGLPSTEGPVRDAFGVFVTGYAQVGARQAEGAQVREVVALDVTANAWHLDLLDSALRGALYTWLLLGGPLVVFSWRRRKWRRDTLLATRHHRYQEDLRVAKERAEAGDRAKGEFLATMSHEVRTPLNSIVGFTNLLLETPLTTEQREYVQTIRTSGEALVQLTGDILDFSKIESGALTLDSSVCDLRGSLEDVLDLMAARAAEKRVELLHWVDPDVPQQVLLDCGRLRQILVNLVGNAVKFTGSGSVSVTVRALTGKGASMAPFDPSVLAGQMVAELEDGGLTFAFAVRDTGIGIAAEDRPKLFQPFSQLEQSSVRRYGGAGLGLAISRTLVRAMGGDIWFESRLGQGSTFHFTVRARPFAAGEGDVVPAHNLANLRVALVTPCGELRDELTRVLQGAGATVSVLAGDALGRERWDICLVDCVESVVPLLEHWATQPSWRPRQMFGFVHVTTGSLERQGMRSAFRMLLNKPLHHRTLIDLLGRTRVESRETVSP